MRLLIPVLLVGAAYLIFLVIQNRDLKRRIGSIDRPELGLPRKERRAYNRELVQRKRDEYAEAHQQKMIELIQGQLDIRKEK